MGSWMQKRLISGRSLVKVRVEKRTQAALRCISRNNCEDKRREGSLRPPWFFVQRL
jgi:hypothetical protein